MFQRSYVVRQEHLNQEISSMRILRIEMFKPCFNKDHGQLRVALKTNEHVYLCFAYKPRLRGELKYSVTKIL